MKRILLGLTGAAALTFVAQARPALAGVDVHIGIGIPAPPVVVFDREPEVVVVPRSQVYYAPSVSDYDMYRFGRWWYINQNGYWYRSTNYRGPFAVVEYGRVPRAIIGVPRGYRRFAPRPPHPPHMPHAPHAPGFRYERHHDGRGRHWR